MSLQVFTHGLGLHPLCCFLQNSLHELIQGSRSSESLEKKLEEDTTFCILDCDVGFCGKETESTHIYQHYHILPVCLHLFLPIQQIHIEAFQ